MKSNPIEFKLFRLIKRYFRIELFHTGSHGEMGWLKPKSNTIISLNYLAN